MSKRSDGQCLLAVPMCISLRDEVDKARGTKGRSQFIREKLAEALGLDAVIAASPDRTGKGGRPKKKTKE